MRSLCVVLAACALGCVADRAAPPASPRDQAANRASLRGRLVANDGGLSAAELARSVVYLEPIASPPPELPPLVFELHHRSTRFTPDLVAVAPGDPIRFVNDDRIFHGAFSYSRPNHFDLGTYGPRQHRVIRFAHSGAVRIHCPIHAAEQGVIVVAPTRWVARPMPSGAYQITGASAGRYWLKAWADGLPEAAYDVTLRPGEAAFRDIVLETVRPARRVSRDRTERNRPLRDR